MPDSLLEHLEPARSLAAAGDFERCLELLSPVAGDGPGLLRIHQLLATAAGKLGRHDLVLVSARYCLRNWSLEPQVDAWDTFRVMAMARECVRQSLHWSEWAGYWQGCTDDASAALERVADALLDGSSPPEGLVTQFDQAMEAVVPDAAVRHHWTRAFAVLADGLAGRPIRRESPMQPPLKKIIVSGKGWSGSGALFDFLREFDGVVPIWGESQYVDGHHGIVSLVDAAGDTTKLRAAAVRFFFGCLLGRRQFVTPELMKSFIEARARMQGDRAAGYAEHVFAVTESLADLLTRPEADRQALLAELCEAVLDRLAVTKPIPAGGYALLDNVVHIDLVHLMRYVGHTDIFCTFRDPRSNFVALVRESPGFVKSAADYAAEQEVLFPKLRALVAKVSGELPSELQTRIHSVQFEEFVLSEPLRRRIASDLGLAWPPARQFQDFRPWESARNVFLHEEFERPEDIALLADALATHCVTVRVDLHAPSH